MRVLAHVSDLHFGRLERAALEPLRRGLRRLAPDLLLVSGDLTQRARRGQFREARAFLDTLPGPQIVVPGNHDVPLYNVLARFLQPFGGYRGAIGRELEPGYADDEIAVIGVNTAHGFTFKKGRVSDAQLARLRARLEGLTQLRILVMHHFCPELCALGADILVAGHAHASRVSASSSLVVHAGTATSSRTREEPNSFNVLRVARGRVALEQHVLRGGAFVRAMAATFRKDGEHWRRDGPA
ncbi:MAG TPA: metallophosphoesterase [Burkholderiales bacterium]